MATNTEFATQVEVGQALLDTMENPGTVSIALANLYGADVAARVMVEIGGIAETPEKAKKTARKTAAKKTPTRKAATKKAKKEPNPRVLTERPDLSDLCFAQVSWSDEGGRIEWKDRLPGSPDKTRRTFVEKFGPNDKKAYDKAVALIAKTLPNSGAEKTKVRSKDNLAYTIQKFWNPDK